MMRFYPFHVGDYQAHTGHLSDVEDLAYRRMLDLYYLGETPLPNDAQWIARRIRMPAAVQEVQQVLDEYFTISEDGFRRNKRCDVEISSYQRMKTGGAKGAAKRWPKDKGNGGGNGEGNGEGIKGGNEGVTPPPLATKNQEPRTRESRATRLPADWEPSDELIAFARKERPDLNLRTTVMSFMNYWQAKSGKDATKLDWDKTFKNWVLNEKQGPVKPAAINPYAGAL
jgi:uncharacterized protein YdaU (DUF1376 family)